MSFAGLKKLDNKACTSDSVATWRNQEHRTVFRLFKSRIVTFYTIHCLERHFIVWLLSGVPLGFFIFYCCAAQVMHEHNTLVLQWAVLGRMHGFCMMTKQSTIWSEITRIIYNYAPLPSPKMVELVNLTYIGEQLCWLGLWQCSWKARML